MIRSEPSEATNQPIAALQFERSRAKIKLMRQLIKMNHSSRRLMLNRILLSVLDPDTPKETHDTDEEEFLSSGSA